MATSENAPNWAKDFLQELSSGAINSTTKAKDQATILWQELIIQMFIHSCCYQANSQIFNGFVFKNGMLA
jgi:hypothetical protein